MSIIKILCSLILLLFNYQALADDITHNKKTEKIIEFIISNSSIDKSAIIGKNKDVGEILKLLENKIVFNAITKILIEKYMIPQKKTLTLSERGILLSLCLYQYCKDMDLYWSQVSDKFGIFPYMNLFFDIDEHLSDQNKDYAIYQISPNKILFLQLLGRGGHNNNYFLWDIAIENGKFKANLLDIPSYIKESKSFEVQPDFLAQSCSYDADKKYFTINVNSGDVHGGEGEENTYQLKDGKLTLIKSCVHKLKTQCTTSF